VLIADLHLSDDVKILSQELKFIYARKKKVNKNHPDYPGYLKKCKTIWEVYEPQLDAVEKKRRKEYPDWNGLDCPWGDEEQKIMVEYHKELRKLRKEYGYLFTAELDDEH